jgi:signal recognition particle receptor subunit beta
VAGLKDLSSVWKNIKEIDLKPIRDTATHPVRIVLVGAQGVGKHTLAEQMRSDPARPGVHTQTSLAILNVEAAAEAPVAHLIIVIVDATRTDFSEEQLLVKKWSESGKNVLIFINKIDLVEANIIVGYSQQGYYMARLMTVPIYNVNSFQLF